MVMGIQKEPKFGIIKETGVPKESKFGIIKETEPSDNRTRGGAKRYMDKGIFALYCRQIHLIADLTLSVVCATAGEGGRGEREWKEGGRRRASSVMVLTDGG